MIDTKELRRICEAAKPYSGSPFDWSWIGAKFGSEYMPGVAAYFEAAIKSLPALVGELDAARAEIERLRGLVREYAEAWDAYFKDYMGGSTDEQWEMLSDNLNDKWNALYAAGKEIAK
jgi:hypothetical protein